MQNLGKILEQNIRKSVPEDYLYIRLKDNTQNWARNDMIRFSQSQPCDAVLFDGNALYMLELKNHKGKSLPISCIRANQIKELSMYQYKNNVKSCIIINFSDLEECYCLFIDQITNFIRKNDRKSIPVDYCRENGIKIENKRLKTNYKYNIEKFLKDAK